MKQWITAFAVSLFSITLLTGCGGSSPENDVKEVVSKMFNAGKTMDFNALAECLAPDQTETLEMLNGMMETKPNEDLENQMAKLANATITFGEVIITDNIATCETIVSGLEGQEEPNIKTVTLENVDGKWYFTELP